MGFQKTVTNTRQPHGVVGELAFDGPIRAKAMTLDSASAANNVVGRAFTVKSEGVAQAGGTGAFAGILINPKSYAHAGLPGDGNPLVLSNGTVGEMLTMGEPFVTLPAAAAIGDLVTYNTSTGVLGSVAEEAVITAAQSTDTLTVSAITKGNLGVGSVIKQASGQLSRIVALGTGTGGTGTYIVDTSQTVASGAATATSVAPSGFATIPNARVSTYTPEGAGLAAITLTN